MSDIVWQDPPPIIGGLGTTQRFVQALKERPGTWALYPRALSTSSAASQYSKSFPLTEWTTRRRDDGKYDYYGRWVGES
jgi:hypothetical protein